MHVRSVSPAEQQLARHIPTIHQRVELERGVALIDTSAFRDAKRGVWFSMSGIAADMTPAEAIALGNALLAAGTHHRDATQPQRAAA